MAVENIVIELSADATKLQPVIDQLVKMGQVTAKDAEDFKKLTVETQKLTTETQKTTEAYKQSATAATQASAAKEAALQKEAARLKELEQLSKKAADPASAQKFAAAIKESENRIKALNTELLKTPKSLNDSVTVVRSLRTQFAEAKLEIERLSQASGGRLTPELLKAQKAAGAIQDKIQDLNRTLNVLNPEQKLGAFLNIGTGISGAFTAATGAMALLGIESEDTQKTLLKVQGALALTQGLQSVLGLKDAFKDLRILLGITESAQKALTTTTLGGAAATNIANVSTKAFSATLLASPLLPIIAILGAMTAAYILVGKAIGDVTEEIEAQNKVREQEKAAIEDQIKFIGELAVLAQGDFKRRIDLLQAQGSKELEIFELRKKGITEQLNALIEARKLDEKFNAEKFEEEKNLRNELKIIDAERTNFLIDQDKKRSDAKKKLLADEKAIADQIFQNQIKANELQARNELDLFRIKLDNLKLLEDREFEDAGDNEQKKFEIVLRYANLRKEVERDMREFLKKNDAQILSDFEANLNKLNAARVKGDKEKDDKVLQQAKDLNAQIIEEDEKRIELQQELARQGAEIFFNVINSQFQANIQALEDTKNARLNAFDEELKSLQELNKNKIISDGKYTQERKKLEKEKADAEIAANKLIAEQKRKQFIFDRIFALSEIAINTAKNAIEQPGLFGALVPFWIALGAAQAGVVLAQPIPKFKKGVLDLQGAGTGESDSIHAMLSKGESVMTARETKMFMPTLSAIRKNLIPAEVMNKFVVEGKGGRVEAYIDANQFDRLAKKRMGQQAELTGKATAKYLNRNSHWDSIRGEYVN